MIIKGIIFGIQRHSIHDGPGIRTTVFLKGCPLSCAWCHNPEGLSSNPQVVFRSDRCIVCKQCETYCPQGAIRWADDRFSRDSGKCTKCGICATYCPSGALESIGKLVSVREVLAEIEKDNLFFEESGGGVTFSGGEPLSQPDFLIATLNACKDRRFHVVIETSGYAPKRVFEELIGSVDLFLFDIKHVASARHKHYTGASCRLILTNLSWVASMSKVIVRLPIIPGVNDDNKSIGQIGTLLASIPDICGIDIIAFHRMASDKYKRLGLEYQYNNVAPPSRERLKDIAERLRLFGLKVR